jgi:Tn3 transposase DDE domain
VRLTDNGGLVIPPLTAEDIPAEADALRTELAGLLPRVPLASVLVELDARTGFTDQLIHAGGKVNRPPELRRNLLYVVIAEATNMGLGAMAESCGVPHDVLAWTAEWYFRPETLEARTPRSSTTITGSRSPRRSAPAPCRPRTGSGSR